MTRGKFPPPSTWLSIKECETAYTQLAKLPLVGEPLPDFDSRDPGKLEGILGAVSQEVFGVQVHPTLLEASSAYFVKLIKGHPLANGNKRSAILFTDVFLYLNGHQLHVPHKQMYALAILVAKEKKLAYDELFTGVKLVFNQYIKPHKRNSWLDWRSLSFKWWQSWRKK